MIYKRIFDASLSFVGLILFFPLFVIVGFLIKINTSGPVIFKQRRVGQHGKLFIIYKFRTMKVNDDRNTISIKGDNRITKIGKLLRKYKLDELPELWNILKGDMSFVGPRPDVPGYADKLIGNERRVLELRPGITGPATLKYANEEILLTSVSDPQKYNDEVIFPDKVKINLEYLKNQCFLLDLRIIFSTIFRKNYR